MCDMPYCPRTTRQKQKVEWRGCSAKFQPHVYLHGEYKWREPQPVLLCVIRIYFLCRVASSTVVHPRAKRGERRPRR